MPLAAQNRALKAQFPRLPFLVAQPPTEDGPEDLVDWRPLYAGANVSRIVDVPAAAELVNLLTP
jgi:nitronate monooxygenase